MNNENQPLGNNESQRSSPEGVYTRAACVKRIRELSPEDLAYIDAALSMMGYSTDQAIVWMEDSSFSADEEKIEEYVKRIALALSELKLADRNDFKAKGAAAKKAAAAIEEITEWD